MRLYIFSIKMIGYVGMSKPKKYVNKIGMGNSRYKIKQTNSITLHKYMSLRTKDKVDMYLCRVVYYLMDLM